MKKCLRLLLIIILCFINIKIGKCVTNFGFGQVKIYNDNQKEVEELQRGKQYHLDFSFISIPNLNLDGATTCAVLNINLPTDLTINGKSQEAIGLGCGSIINPLISLPIYVHDAPISGEVSASIDANLFVYDQLHPESPQSFDIPLEISVFNPKLNVQVQTDKEYYKQNDEVEFTINITNNGPSFEEAIIGIQMSDLGNNEISGDIRDLNNQKFSLKSMAAGESKTIKIKTIVKGTDNFNVFIIPFSLDLQQSGDALFQKNYKIYKPNVVTTNTFNLEEIEDDEEYSFTIKFANNGHVSSGKFTSTFILDERLELLSAEKATIDGNKLTWNIDDIVAGGFIEYTIKVKKIKEIDERLKRLKKLMMR